MSKKTNKSFSKRLRVTKKKKVVARQAGQSHFNSKESGNTQMRKRRMVNSSVSKKLISKYIPFN